MRSRLEIPDTQMPGLERLSQLEPEVVEQIARAARDKVTLRDLEAAVKAAGVEDAALLAETLLSLAVTARHFEDKHVDEIARDREAKDFVALLSTELASRWNDEALQRWRSLEKILRPLLLESLHVLAKSLRLQYEHTNVLTDVQLVTDIRPVLSKDADRPVAGIVCHTLRIEYRSDRSTKHVTIALDSLDLERIKSICERGRTKEDALKKYLEDPKPIAVKVPGRDVE